MLRWKYKPVFKSTKHFDVELVMPPMWMHINYPKKLENKNYITLNFTKIEIESKNRGSSLQKYNLFLYGIVDASDVNGDIN